MKEDIQETYLFLFEIILIEPSFPICMSKCPSQSSKKFLGMFGLWSPPPFLENVQILAEKF